MIRTEKTYARSRSDARMRSTRLETYERRGRAGTCPGFTWIRSGIRIAEGVVKESLVLRVFVGGQLRGGEDGANNLRVSVFAGVYE